MQIRRTEHFYFYIAQSLLTNLIVHKLPSKQQGRECYCILVKWNNVCLTNKEKDLIITKICLNPLRKKKTKKFRMTFTNNNYSRPNILVLLLIITKNDQ